MRTDRPFNCAAPGFTLIELIAVMIVLAIIAVFAAPTLLDLRSDATSARNAQFAATLIADLDNNARAKAMLGTATVINTCNDINTEMQAGRMGRGIPYGHGVPKALSTVLFWGPTPDPWGGANTRGVCPHLIMQCALVEWDALGGYSVQSSIMTCTCPSATCT